MIPPISPPAPEFIDPAPNHCFGPIKCIKRIGNRTAGFIDFHGEVHTALEVET